MSEICSTFVSAASYVVSAQVEHSEYTAGPPDSHSNLNLSYLFVSSLGFFVLRLLKFFFLNVFKKEHNDGTYNDFIRLH